MIDIILGFILILDAVLSFFLPADKNWKWQVGRLIRLCIGIYFFCRGV